MGEILFEGNCFHSKEDMIFIYEEAEMPDTVVIATKSIADDSTFYADVETAKGIINTLTEFVESRK